MYTVKHNRQIPHIAESPGQVTNLQSYLLVALRLKVSLLVRRSSSIFKGMKFVHDVCVKPDPEKLG